jgi:hypothetical protein
MGDFVIWTNQKFDGGWQELYHELHALDRFHTDLKRRQHEEELIITAAAAAGGPPAAVAVSCGDSIAFLKTEVKSQEKHVKTLKKRCLWSKVLEELMEQLVDIVYYMYQEIHDNFGASVFTKEAEDEYKRKTRKLGTLGLALHYANIINQIEGVVCNWKKTSFLQPFFCDLLNLMAIYKIFCK